MPAMAAHAGKPTEHGLDPDGYKSESTFERHIYREREKEKGIHINLMRNFTGRERERYQFGEIYRRERERGAARDINFDEHIIYREREGERQGFQS